MTLDDLIVEAESKLMALSALRSEQVARDAEIARLNQVIAELQAAPVPSPTPLPPPSGTVQFSANFTQSYSVYGFGLQARDLNRAVLGTWAGRPGVKLMTLPGDTGIAGSGVSERCDLTLDQAESDGYEGREHWWAHSILFPDEYVAPPSGWGVAMDFHHTGTSGQASFHVDAMPNPTGLRFRGYGGTQDGGRYEAALGPVVRNVWYDFVYHVKWSATSGYFDAWVNGARKLSHVGPTLYAGMGCYLKLANYHSAFGQASSVVHGRVMRATSVQALGLTPDATWQTLTPI